ncbi:hypothetical protein ACWEV9_35300 [Streptomyces albogriseolus]|uniref:hypothetical protein n=1 Tax=Streptomyces albogriseolus group TaxID=2867120 RepID=UPI0018747FB1
MIHLKSSHSPTVPLPVTERHRPREPRGTATAVGTRHRQLLGADRDAITPEGLQQGPANSEPKLRAVFEKK